MARIILQRKWATNKSTIGEMSIDDKFFCFTLEDVHRDVKVPDETCIPAGRYDIIIDASARFKRNMPHILAVPGFDGIRVHAGNTDKDTHGCVLVGTARGEDVIFDSRHAFDKFYAWLEAALTTGPVQMEIHDIV